MITSEFLNMTVLEKQNYRKKINEQILKESIGNQLRYDYVYYPEWTEIDDETPDLEEEKDNIQLKTACKVFAENTTLEELDFTIETTTPNYLTLQNLNSFFEDMLKNNSKLTTFSFCQVGDQINECTLKAIANGMISNNGIGKLVIRHELPDDLNDYVKFDYESFVSSIRASDDYQALARMIFSKNTLHTLGLKFVIRNESICYVINALKHHPSLTSVELDEPIDCMNNSGALMVDLIAQNENLTHLSIVLKNITEQRWLQLRNALKINKTLTQLKAEGCEVKKIRGEANFNEDLKTLFEYNFTLINLYGIPGLNLPFVECAFERNLALKKVNSLINFLIFLEKCLKTENEHLITYSIYSKALKSIVRYLPEEFPDHLSSKPHIAYLPMKKVFSCKQSKKLLKNINRTPFIVGKDKSRKRKLNA